MQVGKGRILLEGTEVALLGYGTMVQNCLAAHALLADLGVSATVADARFCKPLDRDLIRRLAKNHQVLITVEEGSIGGFGSHVVQFMALDGLLDGKLKASPCQTLSVALFILLSLVSHMYCFFALQWRPLVLPDRYIEHGAPKDQYAEAGLTAGHIAATALNVLGKTREALQVMQVS